MKVEMVWVLISNFDHKEERISMFIWFLSFFFFFGLQLEKHVVHPFFKLIECNLLDNCIFFNTSKHSFQKIELKVKYNLILTHMGKLIFPDNWSKKFQLYW